MDENGMNAGLMWENLKDNWLNIVIVVAALIVIIIVVKIVASRMRRVVERNISEDRIMMKKKTFTFTSVISNLIVVVSFIVAALIIADDIGISITPLLAGAGIAGMIFGFGAQSFIKDLINGIFILMEQWFQVEDVITVGDITGKVEKFNLRTTVIRDIEGTVHYIPNGEITRLSNRTQLWSKAVVEVGVHYDNKTEKVVETLEEVFDDIMADKNYKEIILERPSLLGDGGISELGDSAVFFKMVCKVKAGEQWTIARQLRKRIKGKFDEVGIEIPYPITNVYMREEGK